MLNALACVIKQLVAAHLVIKAVHSNDVNVLNVVLTLSVQAIVLVLTTIALIHVNTIHHVHQMQFASFGIMHPIVSVLTICQTEIHFHIANEFCLMSDLSVNMMTIVQVNWLVFERNVLNHVRNFRHVHHRLVVAF